jgi:hypothetical protein
MELPAHRILLQHAFAWKHYSCKHKDSDKIS